MPKTSHLPCTGKVPRIGKMFDSADCWEGRLVRRLDTGPWWEFVMIATAPTVTEVLWAFELFAESCDGKPFDYPHYDFTIERIA